MAAGQGRMTVDEDTAALARQLHRKLLLVFDFDGVLADSVEVKTAAFARLYEPYGTDVVARVVSHHHEHGGMSRFEKFRIYHRDFVGEPLDEPGVAAMADTFSKLVKQAVIAAPEIPGAGIALQNFRRAGKLCAVNTGTPQPEIIDIVEQRSLAQYFVKVLGAPASKKENLEKILRDCAVPAERAAFFGDARSDLDAAASAGVDFIGVGDWIRDELAAADRSYFWIPDFRQLGPLIPD